MRDLGVGDWVRLRPLPWVEAVFIFQGDHEGRIHNPYWTLLIREHEREVGKVVAMQDYKFLVRFKDGVEILLWQGCLIDLQAQIEQLEESIEIIREEMKE